MDYRAPLDATLNLPTESYSHSLRRLAAAKAAITSFDEAVEEIESATGVTVPKRQLEQLVQRAAEGRALMRPPQLGANRIAPGAPLASFLRTSSMSPKSLTCINTS